MDYKELTADLLSSCDENCAFCKYADIDCECNIAEKAATAITDLLSRAESSEARAENAERERDEAVNDLKKWSICATCIHYSPRSKVTTCKVKKVYFSGGNWAGCSKWEWRGQKEE